MITGIIVGAALGVAVILLVRKVRAESWIYPSALILLPLIYVAFALTAHEWDTALRELTLAAPFVLAGATLLTFRTPISGLATGPLCVVHAAVNIIHDRLLVNSGVPGWYPLFSATLEVVSGFSAIWLASTPPRRMATPSSAAGPTESVWESAGPAVAAESVHR